MKVKIKSYYYYNCSEENRSGAHCAPPSYDENCRGRISCDPMEYNDILEEELDATISKTENQIKIEHENGHILIEEDKITQKRNNNLMIIEAGKTTTCTYQTEHGNIELKIDGIYVEKNNESEIISRAAYLISANGVKPYKVEIVITS